MAQLPPDSHAATASQFTSAFAVAVDNAIGAAMSPPAIAAVVTTLRRLFNYLPFAKPAPRHVRRCGRDAHSGEVLPWIAPSRSGTTMGDRSVSPGNGVPAANERDRFYPRRLRVAPLTRRFSGFKLFASVKKTNGRYKSRGEMSHRGSPYIEQITGESRKGGIGVFPGRPGESQIFSET